MFGPPDSKILPSFQLELRHVGFFWICMIIYLFKGDWYLILIFSLMNSELYFLNLNFFYSFCFTLCLNFTICFTLQRKLELLKVFSWLFTKYCAAGNSNSRRNRRQKQIILRQISKVKWFRMKPESNEKTSYFQNVLVLCIRTTSPTFSNHRSNFHKSVLF